MNRHCVYVRRLFYALLHSSVVVLHLLRSFRGFEAHCVSVCVFARAHFFNIASTFMREFNVLLNDIYSNLLHWKYQFSWLRLINDYVWLCICLIICLFVCMCECACAFMIANANVHVYTLLCSIFSIVHSVHTYLPQLVILISDVWRNLSLPLAGFFHPRPSIELKTNQRAYSWELIVWDVKLMSAPKLLAHHQ